MWRHSISSDDAVLPKECIYELYIFLFKEMYKRFKNKDQ